MFGPKEYRRPFQRTGSSTRDGVERNRYGAHAGCSARLRGRNRRQPRPGILEDCVDGRRVERVESLMWLWILGAYEVVRTMCQAKTCFSSQALDELSRLKKLLSVVRMPAAKMEKPGRRTQLRKQTGRLESSCTRPVRKRPRTRAERLACLDSTACRFFFVHDDEDVTTS